MNLKKRHQHASQRHDFHWPQKSQSVQQRNLTEKGWLFSRIAITVGILLLTTEACFGQTPASIDTGSYFTIESIAHPGRVLDVFGAKKASGTNVTLYGAVGAENQKWKFVPAGAGSYFIESALDDGLILDIDNWGQKDQTNIAIVRRGAGTSAQKFKIVRVSSGNSNQVYRFISAMGNNISMGIAADNVNVVSRVRQSGRNTMFKLNRLGPTKPTGPNRPNGPRGPRFLPELVRGSVMSEGNRPRVRNTDWMQKLTQENPQIRLKDLSIPGTHDAAALYGGAAVECQDWSITQQLEAGIRWFDIRVSPEKTSQFSSRAPNYAHVALPIYHGDSGPISFQYAYFNRPYSGLHSNRSVLEEMRTFLAKHPGETILLQLSTRGTPEKGLPVKKDEALRRWGKAVLDKAPDVISMSSQLAQGSNSQLVDVQGKIVLWEQALIPSKPTVSLQTMDKYKVWALFKNTGGVDGRNDGQNVSLRGKTERVSEYFHKANSSFRNDWVLNGLNGAVGMPPREVAKVINGYFNAELLNKHRGKRRLGVVMMDFPGSGLISNIIQTNFQSPRYIYAGGSDWDAHVTLALEKGIQDIGSAFEKAGVAAANWTEQAANDVANWAETLVNGERVASPKRGRKRTNLPNGFRHYVVTKFHVTNLSSGSDGAGDVEVFGAVNAIPVGKFGTNPGANQFLFNKRAGDRVVIDTHKSDSQTTRKDFYIREADVQLAGNGKLGSYIKVVSRLVEHDDFDNDHMYATATHDVSRLPVGHYAEHRLVVRGDEGELLQVLYAVARIK